MRGLSTLLLLIACSAAGQPRPVDQPDREIDSATRAQVISSAIAALEGEYVFPEKVPAMATAIRRSQSAGEYEMLKSAAVFAGVLTRDLQDAAGGDKHLRIGYRAERLPWDWPRLPTVEERARSEAYQRSIKYGFEKVERLPSNIGYLDLREFVRLSADSGAAADAAMSELADARVLIVDLRRNFGGHPEMIAYLCSYLFDKKTHLNNLHGRKDTPIKEFWTRESVGGRHFGQTKPVFVLTSQFTISGGEEFTYNLRNLKRATIVGERTAGAAHPSNLRRLHEHFTILMPTGRAVSPITGTNWEGAGVEPDVRVAAHLALDRAMELARARGSAK